MLILSACLTAIQQAGIFLIILRIAVVAADIGTTKDHSAHATIANGKRICPFRSRLAIPEHHGSAMG
jgi:hypothetical protein